eukprot:m.106951 g.106951  ORF g.106951 m.106951 type:complete len:393 (+) comp13906_c0_seq1:117-1295(+)
MRRQVFALAGLLLVFALKGTCQDVNNNVQNATQKEDDDDDLVVVVDNQRIESLMAENKTTAPDLITPYNILEARPEGEGKHETKQKVPMWAWLTVVILVTGSLFLFAHTVRGKFRNGSNVKALDKITSSEEPPSPGVQSVRQASSNSLKLKKRPSAVAQNNWMVGVPGQSDSLYDVAPNSPVEGFVDTEYEQAASRALNMSFNGFNANSSFQASENEYAGFNESVVDAATALREPEEPTYQPTPDVNMSDIGLSLSPMRTIPPKLNPPTHATNSKTIITKQPVSEVLYTEIEDDYLQVPANKVDTPQPKGVTASSDSNGDEFATPQPKPKSKLCTAQVVSAMKAPPTMPRRGTAQNLIQYFEKKPSDPSLKVSGNDMGSPVSSLPARFTEKK